MRLKDKVTIITGAGKGQGNAAALMFAREGAKVVVAEETNLVYQFVGSKGGKS